MDFSLLVLALIVPVVMSFTFELDSSAPVQCGTVNLKWQGGVPPFYMTVMVSCNVNEYTFCCG